MNAKGTNKKITGSREEVSVARGSGKRAKPKEKKRFDEEKEEKIGRWVEGRRKVSMGVEVEQLASRDVSASGCTRVRMRVALRWRNSFHATRVPDYISSENHTGSGSVSMVRRGGPGGIKSSSAPKSRATVRLESSLDLVPGATGELSLCRLNGNLKSTLLLFKTQ
ncbi:hypothetical protein QLX08_009696 [Tetragonisca angustula]|uniref:Uncharacterized protein n=1 Tax=Tetragonisca angustula TaxID=166442 RepID=A0AAW0ZG60_9HYME